MKKLKQIKKFIENNVSLTVDELMRRNSKKFYNSLSNQTIVSEKIDSVEYYSNNVIKKVVKIVKTLESDSSILLTEEYDMDRNLVSSQEISTSETSSGKCQYFSFSTYYEKGVITSTVFKKDFKLIYSTKNWWNSNDLRYFTIYDNKEEISYSVEYDTSGIREKTTDLRKGKSAVYFFDEDGKLYEGNID